MDFRESESPVEHVAGTTDNPTAQVEESYVIGSEGQEPVVFEERYDDDGFVSVGPTAEAPEEEALSPEAIPAATLSEAAVVKNAALNSRSIEDEPFWEGDGRDSDAVSGMVGPVAAHQHDRPVPGVQRVTPNVIDTGVAPPGEQLKLTGSRDMPERAMTASGQVSTPAIDLSTGGRPNEGAKATTASGSASDGEIADGTTEPKVSGTQEPSTGNNQQGENSQTDEGDSTVRPSSADVHSGEVPDAGIGRSADLVVGEPVPAAVIVRAAEVSDNPDEEQRVAEYYPGYNEDKELLNAWQKIVEVHDNSHWALQAGEEVNDLSTRLFHRITELTGSYFPPDREARDPRTGKVYSIREPTVQKRFAVLAEHWRQHYLLPRVHVVAVDPVGMGRDNAYDTWVVDCLTHTGARPYLVSVDKAIVPEAGQFARRGALVIPRSVRPVYQATAPVELYPANEEFAFHLVVPPNVEVTGDPGKTQVYRWSDMEAPVELPIFPSTKIALLEAGLVSIDSRYGVENLRY